MNRRLPLTLLLLVLVASCGDESDTVTNRAAAGEVLEGTISDEMLPYDELISRPPHVDPEAAAAAGRPVLDPATGEPQDAESAEEAEEPAGE